MKMEIRNICDAVILTSAALSIKDALIEAVASGAYLRDAYLRDANLSDANLSGANLSGANLSGANLSDANLSGANLRGAYLSGANLRGADLSGADLSGANLSDANLSGANLSGAYLSGAYLSGADLRGAYLSGANLRGANLSGAKNSELAVARIQFIPESGSFEGWKKCRYGVIVRLTIPADAKRSHGSERKCRASHVDVLEVIGGDQGISLYDKKVVYRKGERITADKFDDNRWETCSSGIHFYITRLEAEAHS
jgi:hypothetical protein